MTEPKFKPGEVAVMVLDTKARTMVVEDTTFHGDMQRVHEHYIQPGDTKSRYQLYGGVGFPYSSMIKVPTPEVAEQVVAMINEAHEAGQKLISAATMEARTLVYRAEQKARALAGDPEGQA